MLVSSKVKGDMRFESFIIVVLDFNMNCSGQRSDSINFNFNLRCRLTHVSCKGSFRSQRKKNKRKKRQLVCGAKPYVTFVFLIPLSLYCSIKRHI